MKPTTKRSTQIYSSMELPISILQVETKTYLLYTEEASIISEEMPDSPKPSVNHTTLFHKKPNKFPSPPLATQQDPDPPDIDVSEVSVAPSISFQPAKIPSSRKDKPMTVRFQPVKSRQGACTQVFPQREEGKVERGKLERELYRFSQPMPKKCSVKVINKTLDSVIVSMCEARKQLLDDVLNSVEENKSKEEVLEKTIIPHNDKINIELNKLLSLGTPFGERMAKTLESMINRSEKAASELISSGTPD